MFAQNCPRCRSPRIQRGYNPSPALLRVLCVDELLCNNCSLEFRGFALPGLIKRTPSGRRERPGNRQQSPRFKARLPLSVAVVEGAPYEDGSYSEAIPGCTRDLSKNGLAFVLPVGRIGRFDLADPGLRLWLQLDLPVGMINLRAAPARCQKLGDEEAETDWLIGVRITKISDGNRNLLEQYLSTLG